MGVAILPPQDFLSRHHHHHRNLISPANKSHSQPRRNPNPNPNPNPSHIRSTHQRRRRNSPPPPPLSSSPGKSHHAAQPRAKSPPAMGQVRILKRGEEITPPPPPTTTKPRETRPVSLPGPLPDGFYAGSAFVTSPAPSELPLPAFFTSKRNCGLSEAQNQEIATELRRVLKLN